MLSTRGLTRTFYVHPVFAWCLLVVGVLGLAARAAHGQIQGEVVSVGIAGGSGGHSFYRLGSWVPVRVRLQNRSAIRFEGFLAVETVDLDGDTTRSLSRPILVEPADPALDGRDFWLYYWPRPDEEKAFGNNPRGAVRAVTVLDGRQNLVATLRVEPGVAEALYPEFHLDEHGQRVVVVVGENTLGLEHFRPKGDTPGEGARGGVASVRLAQILGPGALPDRALGLDAVDVIVWQTDAVHPSQLAPEFQLKAILDWVRAGGHLIVTGGNWQLLKEDASPLGPALPLQVTGGRELPHAGFLDEFQAACGIKLPELLRVAGATIEGPFPQVTGKLRAGARPIGPAKNPLVATGLYGAGAVTLVTVNLGSANLAPLKAEQWIPLWQQIAGWRGKISSAAQTLAMERQDQNKDDSERTYSLHSLRQVQLDPPIDNTIDLTSQTAIRVLLAFLFLAVYWALAGPVNHVLLHRYGRTYWSWWIFGAVVVVASLLGMGLVSVVRIRNYQVQHRTFVCGTADSREVAVLAYYGVFAPVGGAERLALPATPGLSYLAPFNPYRPEGVEGFPDPRSYDLANAQPAVVDMPFRNTLKKVQVRWSGEWGTEPGLTAENVRSKLVPTGIGTGKRLVLEGKITNRTAYTLEDVRIVAITGDPVAESLDTLSPDSLFDVSNLKPGATVDLADANSARARGRSLQEILRRVGRSLGPDSGLLHGAANSWNEEDKKVAGEERHPLDLLNVLLETRIHEGFSRRGIDGAGPTEFVRQLTRVVDRSTGLRAARLLVIAHAGRPNTDGVPAPIPVLVGDWGEPIVGHGEILFSWIIPQPPPATKSEEPATQPATRPLKPELETRN